MTSRHLILFFCCLSLTINLSYTKDSYVTCGSLIKLLNTQHNVRLHSHQVTYATGSSQQSVTGVAAMDDVNSYWIVKGPHDKGCVRSARIACGSKLVLQHSSTRLFLHSHYFTSPLSHNQEVSCFGDNNEGDTGDYWTIECPGNFWMKKDKVRLKHSLTEMYLHVPGDTFGRPIAGQREVCGYTKRQKDNLWSVEEGVIISYQDTSSHVHTEL